MIEINLLPEDLRQAEGTPIIRLAAIMGSVVVACGLGVMISFYYMVYIPRVKDDIKQREVDIANLKVREAEVKEIDNQIAKLQEKVQALDNLNQSRMRYGRLFDHLTNSMPDGVWFKGFTVGPEAGTIGLPPSLGGKRYTIQLTGVSTGGTDKEMDNRITELVHNMEREFGVAREEWKPKPGDPPGAVAPPLFGFNKELGARFFHPDTPNITVTTLPAPLDVPKEALKALNAPTVGHDFTMSFTFEMPPPKN